MARQADDANVVAEILAAELRADAERLREQMDLALHLDVAKTRPVLRALHGQGVEVTRGSELHRLQVLLRRRSADYDGEVVGRAGRGAERQDLLAQELDQPIVRQQRRRALVQERLVGRAAALGDEQELVGVLASFRDIGRVEVDLGGQVVARVRLLEHGERRKLRVTQVLLLVGVADAVRERGLVGAVRPDSSALLAHDDRRARVLTHGQDAAGRDVGVLEQVEGDETVVVGGVRIVEDRGELTQVAGTEQVVDVHERLLGKEPQTLRVHFEQPKAAGIEFTHEVGGELSVEGLVFGKGKEIAEVEAHRIDPSAKLGRDLSGTTHRSQSFVSPAKPPAFAP